MSAVRRFSGSYAREDRTRLIILPEEFGVSVRTIKNDIEELTLAHPIETVRGRYGGGVRVADGYYVGRNYLKPKQQELLKKLQSTLQGDDLEVMNSILRDFAL